MIIYLGLVLPPTSSGLAAESDEQPTLRHDSARLAADGVYLPSRSPESAERSYRSRFTLTRALWPGGFVSVALSLWSPTIAVSNRPALCCPDFPHGLSAARSSSGLTI
jgi:hypothetical protein